MKRFLLNTLSGWKIICEKSAEIFRKNYEGVVDEVLFEIKADDLVFIFNGHSRKIYTINGLQGDCFIIQNSNRIKNNIDYFRKANCDIYIHKLANCDIYIHKLRAEK